MCGHIHVYHVIDYILRAVKDDNLDVIALGELFDGTTRRIFKKQTMQGTLPWWKVILRGE